MTKEMLQALAAANGLTIPDERLDLVFRQYGGLARTMQRLESLELAREAEPAHTVVLAAPCNGPDDRR